MPNWGEQSPPCGWGGVSTDRVIEWTPAEIRLLVTWLSKPATPPPPSPKKAPSRPPKKAASPLPKKAPSRPPKKATSPSPRKTSPAPPGGRRYDCQIRGCDHYSDSSPELWKHLASFHEIYEPPGWADYKLPHEPSNYPTQGSVSPSRATTDSSTTPEFAENSAPPSTWSSISNTNTTSEPNPPYPRASNFHKHRGEPKARLEIAKEIEKDTGIKHGADAIAKKLVEMYRKFTDTMDTVGVRNWGADAKGHVRYDYARGKMRREVIQEMCPWYYDFDKIFKEHRAFVQSFIEEAGGELKFGQYTRKEALQKEADDKKKEEEKKRKKEQEKGKEVVKPKQEDVPKPDADFAHIPAIKPWSF